MTLGWFLETILNGTTQAFLTSAAEKTKTQAQNSSQKLKEKTQPQGGTFLLLRKSQEKTQFSKKKKF